MSKKIIILLLFLLNINFASTQTSNYTGVVVDKNGLSLPGITVTEVGTKNITKTDDIGKFSINVKSADALLSFTSVGYKKIERPASKSAQIVMELSNEELQEVVVTALGISKQSKSLGYSVTQLNGDKFTQSRTANIGNALSGKVAGVLVTPPASGVAGSTRVIIRGGSSLNGTDQPLYVVNGVPIVTGNQGSAGLWGGNDAGDGLTVINPDDVESISVLKGNTAAALYGSRAANGVVLITTKSGKIHKGMGLSFNSNTTFDQAYDLIDFQQDYGPGLDGKKAISTNDALNYGLSHWGTKYDGSITKIFNGDSIPYKNLNQRLNDFYQIGVNTTNTIAFVGGNATTNFRFSLSDLRAQDIIPNATLERQVINFNINSKLGKKLTFQFTGQYTNQKTINRPNLSDIPGNANLVALFKPANVSFKTISGVRGIGDNSSGTELQLTSSPYVTNPYWATYSFFKQDIINRFLGNALLRYDITPWLYLQGRVGTDFSIRDNKASEPWGTAYKPFGTYAEGFEFRREDNYDFILGFNKTWGIVGVDAILGGNYLYREFVSKGATGQPLVVPFLNSINNVAIPIFSYNYSQSAINSTYGSVNVSLKNYLYFTLTGRQDVFSTLAANSNSLFYPSFGVSFVLSEVIDLPKSISFLKFRTSWAQVGGGAPNPYGLLTTYGLTGQNFTGNLGIIRNGSIPNQNLQPYTSTEFEFGLDFRFLNNRLGFDIAYYNRKTNNDILQTSISSLSGFQTTIINIGQLSNNGLEFLVNATPIKNKNFQWQISLNFAVNNSLVDNLGVAADGSPIQFINLEESRIRGGERIRHIVGLPAGYIVGKKWLTINGQKVYDSTTGYPIATSTSERLGPGRHIYSGGLNNTFTYKGFKLDFLIDMRAGGNLISGTNWLAYNYGQHLNTLPGRENGLNVSGVDQAGRARTWTISPTNLDTYYSQYAAISENVFYDASYVKLRQFSFGYIFPEKWFKGKIQSLTLSLVARNLLLLWSSIPNVDPESGYSSDSGTQGLEYLALPQTRTMGFNLAITL
ncbi:MAG: SusC/RagA family TonB-linked outer membrane protein [Sediminibacterium sp.]|nr:SusC/RagA family TonB-linked outer membrane protein [Sediminibacterium sp.]